MRNSTTLASKMRVQEFDRQRGWIPLMVIGYLLRTFVLPYIRYLHEGE
jgi:hypothetical protein